MYSLSYTDYVDCDPATIRARIAHQAGDAPALSTVEVTPMSASVSRVVVRMPWNDNDEDVRRESTLRATRYATKVLQAAAVA